MGRRPGISLFALAAAAAGLLLASWGIYILGNPTIVITWSTATEFETAGYAIYRGTSSTGPFEKVSTAFIPASNDPLSGGAYEYIDRDVEAGVTYYYQLEEIELTGTTTRYAPQEARAVRHGVAEGVIGAILFLFSIYLYIAIRRPEQPAG